MLQKEMIMQKSGWDIQENIQPFNKLSQDEIIRLINAAILGNSKHTTSYKFVFFKSILDNIFNVDLNSEPECFLSFDSISLRFTEIYWNLVFRYNLRQMPLNSNGKKSAIETELGYFCKKYSLLKEGLDFSFENLNVELQAELSDNIKKAVVTKYVLGAFCSDTEWQFYHFSKIKKWNGIYLNKNFFEVLAKYRSDFEKVNYFEWIKYLENINKEEDSYKLASKLDLSTERQNLEPYRKILFSYGQDSCFYCGKSLESNAVDHFIPWSFVKDDKLWNFVLACPTCNSKKSDKLTSQNFLTNIKLRNEKLCKIKNPIVQTDFKTYTFTKLTLMYHNAILNGFQTNWTPC